MLLSEKSMLIYVCWSNIHVHKHEQNIGFRIYDTKIKLNSISHTTCIYFSLKHEMRTQGIIKKLCNLINTVNLLDDLLYHILDCLVLVSTKCLDNCEEIWWEKGFTYLHGQLEVKYDIACADII